MLDTDTCSFIIKQHSTNILSKFREVGSENVCISSVTKAELLYGLISNAKKQISKLRRDEVLYFLSHMTSLPWSNDAAEYYAHLRAALEKKGKLIGAMDMMIGAHALSIGATLVSNNTKHYKNIPQLKLTNWI